MISFDLTEEQQLIVDTVRAFARDQIRPGARDVDEGKTDPAPILERAWELGLIATLIPEECGDLGGERSAVTGALVAEELAWGDLAIAAAILSPTLAVIPISDDGSEAQKKELLPLYAGEQFRAASLALTEPRIDFDPNRPFTEAKRRGSAEYTLTGRKCFVPNIESASSFLVIASEGDSVQGFIVNRDASGLDVRAGEKNMGLKGLPTAEIVLEECVVPASKRLGEEAGMKYPLLLDRARVGLAALAVGVARAAFEYARDYAKEREAFGAPIAQKQAIAFMLAEMATQIDAARLLVWEAAWRIDKGLDAVKESALAKMFSADMAVRATDNAVQVLGGHGYIREHPVELYLRNARGFTSLECLTLI